MRKILNEVIIATDIDGTLVLNPTDVPAINKIAIKNPYTNKIRYYDIHKEHVALLRQYKGRGFYIIAWSANGVEHAYSVIEALGLSGIVGLCLTKPMKHIDDLTSVTEIVGNRVFINSNENIDIEVTND